MKRYSALFMISSLFYVLLFVPQVAHSRPRVKCVFMWEENKEKNIRASDSPNAWGDSLTVKRKVRSREYERLINAGKVAARVSGKRGEVCYLNHPENTLIDVKIYKSILQLDVRGRIPNCEDLFASVECTGY